MFYSGHEMCHILGFIATLSLNDFEGTCQGQMSFQRHTPVLVIICAK